MKEARIEGFDLLSKELCPASLSQQKQALNQLQPATQPNTANNMMEGDAWVICMTNAERMLLAHSNRGKVYSILKTLRDRHLDFPGSAVSNYLIKVDFILSFLNGKIWRSWFSMNAKNIGARMNGTTFALATD